MTADYVQLIKAQLTDRLSDEVRRATESAVRTRILRSTATEIMTFVTPAGTRLAPELSTNYVEALWCFARGKSFRGVDHDSAITMPIVDSVQAALLGVLNTSAVKEIAISALGIGAVFRENAQNIVTSDGISVTRETLSASGIDPILMVADPVLQQSSEAIHNLLATSTGKLIVGSIAKAASTSQGKILLAKLVTMTTAKILGSTALRAIVVSAIKKVGIAATIKLVVVKSMAALFPALVSLKIPIMWIVAPLIGFWIYKDVTAMPKKLAAKVPSEVAEATVRMFPEIAERFAELMVASVGQSVIDSGEGRLE